MKISPNDLCPCGSGTKYKKCCRVFHNGVPALTTEDLMRSRYSAYALNNLDYIMATTHPDGPHFGQDRNQWRRDLEVFSLNTRFAGLRILSVEPDIVTFRATLFELAHPARDISFTERSLFRQLNGHWLYMDALSQPT